MAYQKPATTDDNYFLEVFKKELDALLPPPFSREKNTYTIDMHEVAEKREVKEILKVLKNYDFLTDVTINEEANSLTFKTVYKLQQLEDFGVALENTLKKCGHSYESSSIYNLLHAWSMAITNEVNKRAETTSREIKIAKTKGGAGKEKPETPLAIQKAQAQAAEAFREKKKPTDDEEHDSDSEEENDDARFIESARQYFSSKNPSPEDPNLKGKKSISAKDKIAASLFGLFGATTATAAIGIPLGFANQPEKTAEALKSQEMAETLNKMFETLKSPTIEGLEHFPIYAAIGAGVGAGLLIAVMVAYLYHRHSQQLTIEDDPRVDNDPWGDSLPPLPPAVGPSHLRGNPNPLPGGKKEKGYNSAEEEDYYTSEEESEKEDDASFGPS